MARRFNREPLADEERDARRKAARVLRPAVRRANERRERRGLPPLPNRVTAHTLRRTYISMMFAAGAEIPYVMAQVGHEDSKVTLQIYARVLKRRDRDEIGRAFDHLLLGREEAKVRASSKPENRVREGSGAARESG